LQWRTLTESQVAASRITRTTSRLALFRASSVAIAVPKEPPPNTTTLRVEASTSRPASCCLRVGG